MMTSEKQYLHRMIGPDNIDDYLYVDYQKVRNDSPALIVRWQNDIEEDGSAISKQLHTDVSRYTGLLPPEPLNVWQRGQFESSLKGRSGPPPCFQWNGRSIGILMNSWYSTPREIRGGGMNTVYSMQFSQPVKPWLMEGQQLYFEGEVQIPYFASWFKGSDAYGPVGQFSYIAYFKDVTTEQSIAMVINIFDNRHEAPPERIMHDTFVSFASTRFGAEHFVTTGNNSCEWTSSTWKDYRPYKAIITRQNLIRIVESVNDEHRIGLSTEPSDYVLISVGILQETFRAEQEQIALGASFRNIEVYIGS
ncbi:hypothetical protein [Paenibacillus sp. IITD108]|uniref:hypothetical protein n=1 Tax=Paenibacillus sp. IITD108 TaxID=3116649 RepID=UPI002F424A18